MTPEEAKRRLIDDMVNHVAACPGEWQYRKKNDTVAVPLNSGVMVNLTERFKLLHATGTEIEISHGSGDGTFNAMLSNGKLQVLLEPQEVLKLIGVIIHVLVQKEIGDRIV